MKEMAEEQKRLVPQTSERRLRWDIQIAGVVKICICMGLNVLDNTNCFTKVAGGRVSVLAQSALTGGHWFIC
jgi:hypothetical protein